MTTTETSKSMTEMTEFMDRTMRLAETQWRAWGDPGSFATLYQMGFDAWKNWMDIQLSMMDACWKMSCLSFDNPLFKAGTSALKTGMESLHDEHGKVQVRLKKVAAS